MDPMGLKKLGHATDQRRLQLQLQGCPDQLQGHRCYGVARPEIQGALQRSIGQGGIHGKNPGEYNQFIYIYI